MLICAAKKSIPRGFNKHYIPGWDDSCNHLLREPTQATIKEDIDTTATALLHKLDEVRRTRWTEVVEYVDFTHSSRKALQTINKLTGRSTTHSRCPVTPNAIASQLLNNGRFPDANRDFARWTSREVTSLSRAATADANLSSDFTVEKLEAAIKKLKSGKAPGRDNIQGSVLLPMLFNIYISDLPETTSRKYGYADDLAILLRRPCWKEIEEGLNKDMTILVDYLRKWRLQLN